MNRALSGLLSAVALAAAAAAQGDPEDVSSPPNAAAAEEPDAIARAEQEWRAAEAQLGDHRDTGLRAIDLARRLIVQDRAREALEPSRRALQLAERGLLDGVITPTEAAFFVGVAEAAADDGGAGVRRIKRALDRQGGRPSAYDDIIARAWIAVIENAWSRGQWLEALQSAGNARLFASARGDDYAVYIYRVASLEGEAARFRRAYFQAHVAYGWAAFAYRIAYPDRADAATNVVYARLLVLEASMWASAQSTGRRVRESAESRTIQSGVAPHMIAAATREERAPGFEEPTCYEWVGEREFPPYPFQEAMRGEYGAALMAYDLTRDGVVESIRTVVTTPEGMSPAFIEAIRQAMTNWRAVPHPDATDDCLRDRTVVIQFAIG